MQCGALLRVELAAIGSDGMLSASTAPDHSRAEADELDRKADKLRTVWKSTAATAGVAGGGSVVALGLAVVQSSQIQNAEFDAFDRDDDAIASLKSDRRLTVSVGLGLLVGTAALAATAGVLHSRENGIRDRSEKLREQTALVPMFGRGFAGLGVTGRF